jgi:hypothetical protein
MHRGMTGHYEVSGGGLEPVRAFVRPGRRVQGVGPVEPSQINGLGFMLADKKPGKFQMQIEWAKVERAGD